MKTTTTGYLTSFIATYQVEGVAERDAEQIAVRVQGALADQLEKLVSEIARDVAATSRDRRVAHVRVAQGGALVEAYER